MVQSVWKSSKLGNVHLTADAGMGSSSVRPLGTRFGLPRALATLPFYLSPPNLPSGGFPVFGVGAEDLVLGCVLLPQSKV